MVDDPPPFDWADPAPVRPPPEVLEDLEVPPPADAPGASRRRVLVAGAALVGLAAAGGAVAWRTREEPDPRPDGAWTLRPYTGLGAWVDAYDWSEALGGPTPTVTPASIDEMAAAGAQTVFLQSAHSRVDEDVLEARRQQALIDRAHEAGMFVVSWYLPGFTDPAQDLRRLEAAAALDVDGLAVDIEAVTLPDHAVRTARLLQLSDQLRAAVGQEKVLGAITLSAVHLQAVNPAFWPGYPWAELADVYDALLPMAYWTIRKPELRVGGLHSTQEVDRIRATVGDAIPVHLIGGLAEDATVPDVEGMVDVITASGAIGGSLYDWATSTPAQWTAMAPLQALQTEA